MDYYDDPMPEEYWRYLTEDDIRDMVLFVKIVAAPVAMFLALQAVNLWMRRKSL
jgi:hypothetical protein